MREDYFIDPVYGDNSRLERAQWIKQVKKECAWLFNPADFRAKLLTEAGV